MQIQGFQFFRGGEQDWEKKIKPSDPKGDYYPSQRPKKKPTE